MFFLIGSVNYKRSGFTALQLAVDTSFIEMTTNDQSFPYSITFQEFPFPPYTKDFGLEILYEIIFPIVTLFSFMCLLVTVIKRVVEEKASGSKVSYEKSVGRCGIYLIVECMIMHECHNVWKIIFILIP